MSTRITWVVRIVLAATATVLLSLALACGGDDDGEEAEGPAATESAGDETDGDDNSGDDGGNDSGGDGGPGDLGDYFAEIDAIFEDADAESDEIEQSFDEAYTNAVTVEDAKDVLGTFLAQTRELQTAALDSFEAVDPPDEAEDAHNGFLEAGRDLVGLAERLMEGVEQVETEEDLNALSADFEEEGNALASAADEACFNLQDIADQAAINVDLNCQD